NLTGRDEPERLTAAIVTAGFFQMLGTEAALGRVLLPEDDQPANENVVVLSDALWRRRFGADREIIGRSITLNNRPHIIVGVLPTNSISRTTRPKFGDRWRWVCRRRGTARADGWPREDPLGKRIRFGEPD